MDATLSLRHARQPAAPDWVDRQLLPGLDRRRRVVEACRAELAWARADWIELTGTDEDWPLACLPHERMAARLVEIWGGLQPLEGRLREGLQRLAARRHAGWPSAATLDDVQRYRAARRLLWRAFLAAADDYRAARANAGCTDSASGWARQKASIASNLWRSAS